MPLAEFRFRPGGRRRTSREHREKAAGLLLGALWQNGQTEGERVFGWVRGVYHVWCTVPAADFLEDRHSSPWVRDALDEVVATFGEAPSVKIIGDDRPVRSPSWEAAKSLLLFTNFLDPKAPVWRGDVRCAIPAYKLPLDPLERMHLQFWAEEYRDTDSLWIGSGALEGAAYRQMADLALPLLKRGRGFAGLIEERTSRPTYVYVHRYYGRKGSEARRRCPGCGARWTRRTGRGPVAAWSFALRCDPCRLVSDLAVEFDEPRLARIGDFVPTSPPSGSRRRRPRPAR